MTAVGCCVTAAATATVLMHAAGYVWLTASTTWARSATLATIALALPSSASISVSLLALGCLGQGIKCQQKVVIARGQ